MKHTISPDRTKLTIHVDLSERAELRHWKEDGVGPANHPIESDQAMIDWLEPLTCNSELDWTSGHETRDLTDAPMLAIFDDDGNGGRKVFERWAFMDYQVRSVLEDLRDTGECVFVGGALTK